MLGLKYMVVIATTILKLLLVTYSILADIRLIQIHLLQLQDYTFKYIMVTNLRCQHLSHITTMQNLIHFGTSPKLVVKSYQNSCLGLLSNLLQGVYQFCFRHLELAD